MAAIDDLQSSVFGGHFIDSRENCEMLDHLHVGVGIGVNVRVKAT